MKARGRTNEHDKERKEEEAAAKAKREPDAMGEFERGRNTDSLEVFTRAADAVADALSCVLYAACFMRTMRVACAQFVFHAHNACCMRTMRVACAQCVLHAGVVCA